MIRSFLLLISLAVSVQAFPQAKTIVNTEKSEPTRKKGFHFGMNAALSFYTGNVELIDLDGALTFGYKTPKHWIRLIGGGDYLSSNGIRSLNSRYGQLRYNYFIRERLSTYHFLQLQDNFSLFLMEREVVGSGLRKSIAYGDSSKFDIGFGAMYERERLDSEKLQPYEKRISQVWRITSLFVLRNYLGKNFTLLNTAYVQPRIDDFGDLRILNEMSLLTKITKHFKIDVSVYWRYDSQPPEMLEPYDLGIDVGVVASW